MNPTEVAARNVVEGLGSQIAAGKYPSDQDFEFAVSMVQNTTPTYGTYRKRFGGPDVHVHKIAVATALCGVRATNGPNTVAGLGGKAGPALLQATTCSVCAAELSRLIQAHRQNIEEDRAAMREKADELWIRSGNPPRSQTLP
jgi:hypothetical protein